MTPTQTDAGWLSLIAMMTVGLGVFAYSAYHRTRLLMAGQPLGRFDQIPKRIMYVIQVALGQKKMFKEPLAGFMHAIVFWGFCVFSIRTVTLFGEGLYHGFRFPLLGWFEVTWGVYLLSKEIFAILVSIGALFWIFWRFAAAPKRISNALEAYFILLLILTLMVTDLYIDGTEIAAASMTPWTAAQSWSAWLPVSNFVGMALSGLSLESLQMIHAFNWWLHLGVILLFLNLLPYGKHFHVITAIPNTFFVNLGPKGKLPRIENIEEAENYGFSRVEHFDWKDILDAYTCTECGRCSSMCPAYNTDKPLSPKHLSMNLRNQFYSLRDTMMAGVGGANGKEKKNGGDNGRPSLIHDIITTDVLWDCTTCRACEEACPVSIEFVDKIVQMRRFLVLEEAEFPSEVVEVFNSLETQMNPYSMGAHEREDWCRDLEVPIMSDVEETDVLFWVGCAGAFDERNKKVSRALVRIFQKAGVNFAILGEEESCTGDAARRIGNEYLFEIMAQQNIEIFQQYKFKKIVTNCPHCFNTLKNEYPDFGSSFEVVHSADFVAELIREGKISPDASLGKSMVFHDSCYLGRYNDIYDSPRQIMAALGGTCREASLTREKGLCCGAGGGRIWMEEDRGSHINKKRVDQLVETNAELIVSACPFCMTMLEDGIKTTDREEKVKAYDILELVEQSLA